MKKILFYGLGLLLVVVALMFVFGSKNGKGPDYKLVAVEKGDIVEKALAVGTIEPEKEIKVKSAISGLVSDLYFKIGDTVEKGDPLFKIAPNPTPLEYADAQRNMEIAEVLLKQARKDQERQVSLFKENILSSSDMENGESKLSESNLRYLTAYEKFKLLEKGRIQVAGKNIDSIIKSPITGVVLSQEVEVGDPVVPLTNFQPGTDLCAMADMGEMLFKGTVDEIDVGKIQPGMAVEIKVGALPDLMAGGKLLRISPKARKDGNATLFDIEILILKNTGNILRAGYSATAYVKIREKKNVLVIPERLVTFENGKRFVEVKKGETIEKIEIKTGLSDSLNIEVTAGVQLGQQIVDRPPKEIM